MPFAIGGGDVALSSDGDHGLAIFSPTTGRLRTLAPLGDGSDAATHVSPDGRWIAVRHTPISQSSFAPPQVVAIDVVTATVAKLGAPATHVVQPIGFLAGGAP